MVQKALISFIFVFSSISKADCDWKTITKTDNGYLYSRECHLAVGKNLTELDNKKQQSDLFRNSSDLFKQSYELEKERADLWYKESKDLEKTINSNRNYSEFQKVAYFSLGLLVMYGAVQAVK